MPPAKRLRGLIVACACEGLAVQDEPRWLARSAPLFGPFVVQQAVGSAHRLLDRHATAFMTPSETQV